MCLLLSLSNPAMADCEQAYKTKVKQLERRSNFLIFGAGGNIGGSIIGMIIGSAVAEGSTFASVATTAAATTATIGVTGPAAVIGAAIWGAALAGTGLYVGIQSARRAQRQKILELIQWSKGELRLREDDKSLTQLKKRISKKLRKGFHNSMIKKAIAELDQTKVLCPLNRKGKKYKTLSFRKMSKLVIKELKTP